MKVAKTWDDALQIVKNWKSSGDTIVFTNGCFDILHPGHVDYLSKAKAMGNRLVIGLNDDNSVRLLKGSNRPINNIDFRSTMLASLNSTDLIVVFREETPLQLLEKLEPHVLVKGGDYLSENVVGSEFVISKGGKVEIIPFLKGFSTTSIIGKMKKQ